MHMKRCLTSPIIREMQIKNYNEVPLHTGQNGHDFVSLQNNKRGRGCGEKGNTPVPLMGM